MSRRGTHTRRPADVTVGWVEVWTISPDELVREAVALKRPQTTARWEDGHYRLRERRSLNLPAGLVRE